MTADEETDAFVAKEERLFQEHLKDVFGDRRKEFSAGLVDLLRTLWRRGRMAPQSAAKFNPITYKPKQRLARIGPMELSCPDCTGLGWNGRDATKCLRCDGRGTVTSR